MKKLTALVLALALCAALLTACGASAGINGQAATTPNRVEGGWSSEDSMDSAPMEEMGEAPAPQPGEQAMAPAARKIIHNARLYLESVEFDKTRSQLMQKASELGGYVESSSEEGNAEAGDRWAEYVLRIPSEHYTAFLQAAEGAGSLQRKDEDTEDITRVYVDVEARLESLRIQEQRLQELAAQAESMEDLLAIEAHLSDVRYEIESYSGQQRTYDDLVDYSTITVTLSEVTVYTPVAQDFPSRVMEALADSWEQFKVGCQEFAIWLIYAFPTLVVLVVVLVIVLALRRRHKKNAPARARRKAEKQAAKLAAKQKKNAPAPQPPADGAAKK